MILGINIYLLQNSIEITPQNIKAQGFFSMKDHGIKRERSNSNLKVPSILAKKSKFNAPSQVNYISFIFNIVMFIFINCILHIVHNFFYIYFRRLSVVVI